jgi:hypothetical protein
VNSELPLTLAGLITDMITAMPDAQRQRVIDDMERRLLFLLDEI